MSEYTGKEDIKIFNNSTESGIKFRRENLYKFVINFVNLNIKFVLRMIGKRRPWNIKMTCEAGKDQESTTIHKRYLTECERRVSQAASCNRLILMKIICINLTTLGPMYRALPLLHNPVGFCPKWNIVRGLSHMSRDNDSPKRSYRNNN